MNKTGSILTATLGTLALISTFTLAGAGAATADTAEPSATPTASSSDANGSCWVDASSGESLCVAAGEDLIAAVQQEAGVTINVPSTLTINGVSAAQLRVDASASVAATTTAETIDSALYEDINYGGSVLYLSVPGTGCGEISSLVPYGWNDRASSFKSFNGCETAIWSNINFSGTKLGYTTNKSSLGSMNDQASSWATD